MISAVNSCLRSFWNRDARREDTGVICSRCVTSYTNPSMLIDVHHDEFIFYSRGIGDRADYVMPMFRSRDVGFTMRSQRAFVAVESQWAPHTLQSVVSIQFSR